MSLFRDIYLTSLCTFYLISIRLLRREGTMPFSVVAVIFGMSRNAQSVAWHPKKTGCEGDWHHASLSWIESKQLKELVKLRTWGGFSSWFNIKGEIVFRIPQNFRMAKEQSSPYILWEIFSFKPAWHKNYSIHRSQIP